MESKPRNSINHRSRQHSQSQTQYSYCMTEDIYSSQKEKITIIKQKIINSVQDDYSTDNINQAEKTITFNSYINSIDSQWSYSPLTTVSKHDIETPLFNLIHWTKAEKTKFKTGIEVHNLLFSSEDTISYNYTNAELFCNFVLRNEASFWLILHSNQTINEYSSIIHITKRENSQKVFISLGVMVDDNKTFKEFSKQQLIDFSQGKSGQFIAMDECSINLTILDAGSDSSMIIKAKINNNLKENEIKADFFLPVNGNHGIIFGGSGSQCKMNELICNTIFKPKYQYHSQDINNHSNQRNCDCCIIY